MAPQQPATSSASTSAQPQTYKPHPSDPPFNRHIDSVLCCDVDRRGKLAVSGGIDDVAWVWEISTRRPIFRCDGHKDSVVACQFSKDFTYVATGDMKGYVQIRNTHNGKLVFDWQLTEIHWIHWHRNIEHIVLAGTATGDFWMWNCVMPQEAKVYQSFGSPTTAAAMLHCGFRMAVAYENGAVRIFHLKTQEVEHYIEGGGEEATSIDINPGNTLIACSFSDCTIKLISIVTGKLVAVLHCTSPKPEPGQEVSPEPQPEIPQPEPDEDEDEEVDPVCLDDDDVIDIRGQQQEEEPSGSPSDQEQDSDSEADMDTDDEDYDYDDDDGSGYDSESDSCEYVAFSRCGSYLASGNVSGCACVWDVATLVCRHRVLIGGGVTRVFWDDYNRVVFACLDGVLRIYDHNMELLNKVHEHTDAILDCKSRGGKLVTCSEDRLCRAYALSEL